VLDHLFNVDKLVEKKFTPAQAETGLLLFRNDVNKVSVGVVTLNDLVEITKVLQK